MKSALFSIGVLFWLFSSSHIAADEMGDVQGIVAVKSPTDSRWTLAGTKRKLNDGDRVRTGPRGANAVRLIYQNGNSAVLGPDSILEIGKGNRIRLLKGELELVPSKKNAFRLAPGDHKVNKPAVWRAAEEKGKVTLTKLPNSPLWLTGFKEVNSIETMGSLVAQVDGRDVPLTVGYHHVSVEIRDQIARTTIEQSFVNHTDSPTEGVFYFPLPQEASIAGFGMWIGNEYVEADVVEKQRAREIYETILRERRDPALLEWTGGNLFKARVFPILPHSEKRVKIVYTQVLPLDRDGQFRYRYALRSELMRQNPVRDLKIDVRVFLGDGIASATCASHRDLARVDVTKNAAHIELAEQEYTPQSDFEIAVKPKEPDSMITLSPHRRGEDGYFLASVRVPPFPPRKGGPRRTTQQGTIDDSTGLAQALLPPGDSKDPQTGVSALRVLFLADTSGSIDAAQRSTQRQAIEALLNQLGEDDRFQLAVCDVDCLFWRDEPQPVTGQSIDEAIRFLDRRISLGWSDLKQTFSTLKKKKLPAGTQVIYLGDGIPATAETDPNELAKFLKNLFADTRDISFHAVATGSTFENVTMQAIASLGAGGSFRQVEDSAAVTTAGELFDDILRPGWSDLKIKFGDGLRTARVYPDEFQNVAPGSQRFVVGRYLPGDKTQSGSVTVSARMGKNHVTWKLPVAIPVLREADGKGGDTGNSFIPRLWARRYLDVLLEQGAAPAIRDEIVSLSEEYKIMTPYTSFLVLESEEDRRRFKVKRRFQMRDGERFFTDGREAANFELVRQQMKRAAAWRQHLREQVLSGMRGMGRGPLTVNGAVLGNEWAQIGHGGYARGRGFAAGGGAPVDAFADGFAYSAPMAERPVSRYNFGFDFKSDYGASDPFAAPAQTLAFDEIGSASEIVDFDGFVDYNSAARRSFSQRNIRSQWETDSIDGLIAAASSSPAPVSALSVGYDTDYVFRGSRFAKKEANANSLFNFSIGQFHHYAGFLSLFPSTSNQYVPAEDFPESWSADVKELARSLRRDSIFFAEDMAYHLHFIVNGYDTVRGVLTSKATHSIAGNGKPGEWIAATGSWDQSDSPGVLWNGNAGGQRFVYDAITELGRTRKTGPADTRNRQQFNSIIFPDPGRQYPNYEASIEKAEATEQGDNLVWLILKIGGQNRIRLLIDPERAVILQHDVYRKKDEEWKTTVRNLEFVEFAGRHFVKVSESYDFDGKRNSRTEFEISEGDGGLFAAAQARMKNGVVLGVIPELLPARRRIAEDNATLEDWIKVMDQDIAGQQWESVVESLTQFENLAQKPDSTRWLRLYFLQTSRRNELLRERLLVEAKRIAENRPEPLPLSVQVPRAERILSLAQSVQAGERLEILDLLEPVVTFGDDEVYAHWQMKNRYWRQLRGQALDQWQGATTADRLAWWKSAWEDYVWDSALFRSYSNALWNSGERDAAIDLEKERLKNEELTEADPIQIMGTLSSRLEQSGRYAEAAEVMEPFLKSDRFGEYQFRSYLRILVYAGQKEKSERMIRDWLRTVADAPTDEVTPNQLTRAKGAIRRITESRGYSQVVHPRWHSLLIETAVACAKKADCVSVVQGILNQYRFQKTDGNRIARRDISDWVLEQKARIDASHLQQLISYCDLETEQWKQIREAWLNKWRLENDEAKRRGIGDFISQQSRRFFREDDEALLAFRRERIERTKDKNNLPLRRLDLFDQIIASQSTWKEAAARELFGLLPQLGQPGNEEMRIAEQASALLRLSDWIGKATAKSIHEAEEKGVEEMSIAERKDFGRRLKEGGIEAVVRELSAEIPKRQGDQPWAALLPWMDLELVYFLARSTDPDAGPLLQKCLDWLGESPAAWKEIESPVEQARLTRVWETALFLASTHFEDKPQLAAKVAVFAGKGLALDDPQRVETWRLQKWRLLTAKGDREPLEKSLREWADADEINPAWRRALGYLLAETDRLKLAVAEFEKLEKQKQLNPADAAALAGWQQALGRKGKQEKAQQTARNRSSEQRLSQAVNAIRRRVQSRNGGPTGKLETQDIETATELFRRCHQPNNYMYQLSDLYRHTKDPRLPRAFVPGLMGRTAQEIYPALQRFFDITRYIEEEASVDESMLIIEKLRKEKLVQGEIDERALDMIEAELKRRASEVLNQPGQHVKFAVAALQRAMARDFETGERQLMARWLRRYGASSSGELRKEIYAAYRKLDAGEDDVFQRLEIVNQWAELEIEHNENAAADRLTVALDEARAKRDGVFTSELLTAFSTLIRTFENRKLYAEAETRLLAEIDRAANEETRHSLVSRLFSVYRYAVTNRGATSFGSGEASFVGARKWMLQELRRAKTGSHRSTLINTFGEFHLQAHRKKIPNVAVVWKQFAFEDFPPLIANDRTQADDMVEWIGYKMRDINGNVDAIEFVVTMLESEPDWVREESYQGIWNECGDSVAAWRADRNTVLPPALADRLLALMKKELMWQLEIGSFRQMGFCDKNSGSVWAAKLDEFSQVGEAFVEKYAESETAVVTAARFFFDYPERRKRAGDLLLGLHDGGRVFRHETRDLIGNYLERTERWTDSERVHRDYVKEFPKVVNYHLRLTRSLFKQEKNGAMKEALAAANDSVEANQRAEADVAKLASLAVEVEEFDRAVEWYEEAIRKHESTHPNRGIGQGVVSEYYRKIAAAHSGLGRTKKAVDAASAAIVAWGPRHDQRVAAVNRLADVIRQSKDIDAFAEALDAEAEESGLEKPIVRKQLGKVYLEKKDGAEKAARQFRIALETQPDDGETHRLLVLALDKMGDADAARDQLIESIRLAPRDLGFDPGFGEAFRASRELPRAGNAP